MVMGGAKRKKSELKMVVVEKRKKRRITERGYRTSPGGGEGVVGKEVPENVQHKRLKQGKRGLPRV